MSQERFKIISAVHLFLIQDRNILLLRRFNTGFEDGNYSVPAGHIDGDETATNTMVREAREEAGIQIDSNSLKVVHVMHRKSTQERIDFFLTTDTWKGEIFLQEPDKCDELRWYPLNNLPNNVIPYVKHALDNFQSGVFYSEFGW